MPTMKTRKAFALATALAGVAGGCQPADPAVSPGAVPQHSAAPRAEDVRPRLQPPELLDAARRVVDR